jgi:N-acetyl-anhydromuramyl-L-alanine amidase AmpD
MVDISGELPVHCYKKWKKRKETKYIVLHCTGSENQRPIRTAEYHIGPNHISKTGCPGICYHTFITESGVIFKTSNFENKLWHAGWINNKSLAVVMAYSGYKFPQQYWTTVHHIAWLCVTQGIGYQNVIGHREVGKIGQLLGRGGKKVRKICPGKYLDMDGFRADLRNCSVLTKLSRATV